VSFACPSPIGAKTSAPTSNGREEPVLEPLQYWGWWALAPQGIYFREAPGSPRLARVRLKFFDLTSRRITELTTLEKPVNQTIPVICL
jgi:hypothetical protein